jgi:hypothetical protein
MDRKTGRREWLTERSFIPPVCAASGGGDNRKLQVLEKQDSVVADLLATVAVKIGE